MALRRGVGRVEAASAKSVFFKHRFGKLNFTFFCNFGTILGVFWRVKSMNNSIVATCFPMCFFHVFFVVDF